MYDTGPEVIKLLSKVFVKKVRKPNRPGSSEPQWEEVSKVGTREKELLMELRNPNTKASDKKAIRRILTKTFGVDPIFEVQWARDIHEKPELDRPEVRETNRKLLFDGYFNKRIKKEDRVEAREKYTERLGHDPLANEAMRRDWYPKED